MDFWAFFNISYFIFWCFRLFFSLQTLSDWYCFSLQCCFQFVNCSLVNFYFRTQNEVRVNREFRARNVISGKLKKFWSLQTQLICSFAPLRIALHRTTFFTSFIFILIPGNVFSLCPTNVSGGGGMDVGELNFLRPKGARERFPKP